MIPFLKKKDLRGFTVVWESKGWCIASPDGVVISAYYTDKNFATEHLHAFLDACKDLTAFDFNEPSLQKVCNDTFLYKSTFWVRGDV